MQNFVNGSPIEFIIKRVRKRLPNKNSEKNPIKSPQKNFLVVFKKWVLLFFFCGVFLAIFTMSLIYPESKYLPKKAKKFLSLF